MERLPRLIRYYLNHFTAPFGEKGNRLLVGYILKGRSGESVRRPFFFKDLYRTFNSGVY